MDGVGRCWWSELETFCAAASSNCVSDVSVFLGSSPRAL